MKAEQVDQALHQKFVTEGERLVFWHDPNSEFEDYAEGDLAGDIADVQVLNVAAMGGLSAKLRIEREDAAGKYLIYTKGEIPLAEEDWLLDIRIYSAQFHADVASLWLQELGLASLSLREHLKARAVFLGSQERRKKLSRLVSADDDAAALDLKMMAVVAGSTVASPFHVLRAICHGHEEGGRFDLSEPPEVMTTLKKMGLLPRFWDLMQREFGYAPDTPTVAGLLRGLFVSELFKQTDGATMDALAHHRLPTAGQGNAVVFLTQWRDSSGAAGSYDAAAAAVAGEQHVREPLAEYGLDVIRDVYTFWDAERLIVRGLKDRVLDERESVDVEAVRDLANERKAGHWLAGPGSEAAERSAIADAYDAVVAAAELFALGEEHRHAFKFDTPGEVIAAYQASLHRFDRLYRRFCVKARPATGEGWDLLKTLAEEIERLYDQGFLQPLGIEWSRLLDDGFLDDWSLDGIGAQQDFYADHIRPHLAESERKRAFVIISDAFRYEAAAGLTKVLNGRFGLGAELSAMLGVLPSYTALGMASLLPHETISYSDKDAVLADGNSTTGTEARSKQLATVGGAAWQAKDMSGLKADEARDKTRGTRIVYLYHNIVDATGDNPATEHLTFNAVSDCIEELAELVQLCVNTLGAGKVWVTADHGFLFRQTKPAEVDKNSLTHKPPGALRAKPRFMLGRDLGPTDAGHHGMTEVTASAAGGMEFWAPRAANLFHFGGGARFVHGGAMPQEVVIPLVTVTRLRGKRKEGSRSEKVSVQVLGSNHKITTPTYRFEVIQTEAIGERKKPLVVRAAVYDGAEPITSVETVTFDSSSDSIEERKESIRFELRSGRTYDKAAPYRLVLRDAESEAEVLSVPVVIDRSFDDDF